MTNDEIVEMAKQANKVHIEDEVFFDFCVSFARLIAEKQKEEDAVIVENSSTDDEASVSWCATAIRSQK
jgi:hypothetical protein